MRKYKLNWFKVKNPEVGQKYKKTWSKSNNDAVVTNQPGESIAIQNHKVSLNTIDKILKFN